MISMKAKYGLKALLRLAVEYGKGPVLISDLAVREGIPRKFLELILLELKNQGILVSKKGRGGGYSLRERPGDIIVGHILRILDGPLALLPCVSEAAHARCPGCGEEGPCGVQIVMKEVREAMSQVIDHTTLADAAERVARAEAEEAPMYHI